MAAAFSAHGDLASHLIKYPGLFGLYQTGGSPGEAQPHSRTPQERVHGTDSTAQEEHCPKNTRMVSSIVKSTYSNAVIAPAFSLIAVCAGPAQSRGVDKTKYSARSPWTSVWEPQKPSPTAQDDRYDGTPVPVTDSPGLTWLDNIVHRFEETVSRCRQHFLITGYNDRLSLPRSIAQRLTDLRAYCDAAALDKLPSHQPHPQNRVSSRNRTTLETPRIDLRDIGLGQSPRLWAAHFRALCSLRMQVAPSKSHFIYGLMGLVAAQSGVWSLHDLLSADLADPGSPSSYIWAATVPTTLALSTSCSNSSQATPTRARAAIEPKPATGPSPSPNPWAGPSPYPSLEHLVTSAGKTPRELQLVLSPLSATLPTPPASRHGSPSPDHPKTLPLSAYGEEPPATVLAQPPATVVRASASDGWQWSLPRTIARSVWWPECVSARSPISNQEAPSSSPWCFQPANSALLERLIRLEAVETQLEDMVQAMAELAGVSGETVRNVLQGTGFLAS